MRHLITALLAAALVAASGGALVRAQSGNARAATATQDAASIDSILTALYDTISGPAGERDWARFRALFAPDARLIPVRVGPEGSVALTALTVEQFVESSGPVLMERPFFETEVARRTESFGRIAHAWSTYESRNAPEEAPFSRGINSVQLFDGPDGWRIVTVYWDAERPGVTVPDQYLE